MSDEERDVQLGPDRDLTRQERELHGLRGHAAQRRARRGLRVFVILDDSGGYWLSEVYAKREDAEAKLQEMKRADSVGLTRYYYVLEYEVKAE